MHHLAIYEGELRNEKVLFFKVEEMIPGRIERKPDQIGTEKERNKERMKKKKERKMERRKERKKESRREGKKE